MLFRHLGVLLFLVSTTWADVHVVAHRGASAAQIENTLEAIDLAWDQGADAVELDFRMTRDGHIVCIHDVDTARVSGQKLVVADTDLVELRALKLRGASADIKGTLQIPTLNEVLQQIPVDKYAYLELKSDVRIVTPFLETLRQSSIQMSQVVVISFDSDVLHAVHVQVPELKTLLLVSLKRRGFGLKPSFASIMKKAESAAVDGVSVKAHPMMPYTFGEDFKSRGFEFHVWTVDSAAWGIEMVKRGAQSITTNRPDLMKPALESSKHF